MAGRAERLQTTRLLIMAGLLWTTVAAAGVPIQGQIEGQVVQAFPTMIVIKDDRGQATVLQLTPRTQVSGPFKPGDTVVASVTLYGVTSVQRQSDTAMIP